MAQASYARSLQYGLELGGYLLGTSALRNLPLAIARRGAATAARAYFDRGGKRVRWTLANLRLAMPDRADEELAEIGRESYVRFAWNAIDSARAERWADDELSEHCDLHGFELLQHALARGKGALLLTLHMGSWEVAQRVISKRLDGVRLACVSRPLKNPFIQGRMQRMWTRDGLELIPHKKVAAVRMLRALRANRPVIVVNDQYSTRGRGAFVPLFGVRCSTSTGIATIARKTGAPVVPAYIFSDAPDHHQVRFLPPLPAPTGDDKAVLIEKATAGYNDVLEQIIRRHPTQWMWGHRRFRHSPDLEVDPYR